MRGARYLLRYYSTIYSILPTLVSFGSNPTQHEVDARPAAAAAAAADAHADVTIVAEKYVVGTSTAGNLVSIREDEPLHHEPYYSSVLLTLFIYSTKHRMNISII